MRVGYRLWIEVGRGNRNPECEVGIDVKVVVLLSGGMDSVTALYEANVCYNVVAALSVDYGAKHNACELPFAAWHCEALSVPHEVVALPFVDRLFSSNLLTSGDAVPDGHYEEASMKQTVVPFRNAIMLSIATGFAESLEATGVVIAAHSGDHAIYPDCRESFMSAMGSAMELGTYANVALIRPFIDMTKEDIVNRAVAQQVPLAKTWSCYKGGDVQCGTCGTCVERREAFLRAGVPDPTTYLASPPLPERPSE
ncbi:MAG: 7-cyano-7-deazaguanine synthase [Candidatus Promineifilaceae bacterium]|jgi:7-cyano-7-deazaguanine synthase